MAIWKTPLKVSLGTAAAATAVGGFAFGITEQQQNTRLLQKNRELQEQADLVIDTDTGKIYSKERDKLMKDGEQLQMELTKAKSENTSQRDRLSALQKELEQEQSQTTTLRERIRTLEDENTKQKRKEEIDVNKLLRERGFKQVIKDWLTDENERSSTWKAGFFKADGSLSWQYQYICRVSNGQGLYPCNYDTNALTQKELWDWANSDN